MSMVVPTRNTSFLPEPLGVLCACAVPESTMPPSSASTTVSIVTRDLVMPIPPFRFPPLLRIGHDAGLVDRECASICVERRRDPERDGREVLSVPQWELVQHWDPERA